jgi:UDP-N-acetylglucosamine acyltransferase
MVAGDRARLVGVNSIGLERRGFAPATVTALKSAFRTLFYGKLLRDEAIAQIREECGTIPEVSHLLEFIANSPRGVVGRERE